jgi:hypothetical protein
MTPEEHDRIIRRSVVTAILGVAIAIGIYAAREVLLTLYFSGLLAVGLSPGRPSPRAQPLGGRTQAPHSALAGDSRAVRRPFSPSLRSSWRWWCRRSSSRSSSSSSNLPKYADEVQASLIARGLDEARIVLERHLLQHGGPGAWLSTACTACCS